MLSTLEPSGLSTFKTFFQGHQIGQPEILKSVPLFLPRAHNRPGSRVSSFHLFQTGSLQRLFSKQSGVQCFNMCGRSHYQSPTHPSRIDSLQQYKLSNFCLVTESLTFMAGTHSFPALDSWYSLGGKGGGQHAKRLPSPCSMSKHHALLGLYSDRSRPVNPGDALLHDAPDLLEHIGVLLVHPVRQVPAIVQDLMRYK